MWNTFAKYLVKIALWAATHPQVVEDVVNAAKTIKAS